MILNDIISDYRYASKKLHTCDTYFTLCVQISSKFYKDIPISTRKYYNLIYDNSPISAKETLISSIDLIYDEIYNLIVDLIHESYEFYKILDDLQHYKYKNKFFENMLGNFQATANTIRKISLDIVRDRTAGIIFGDLLPNFLENIDSMLRMRDEINILSNHFDAVEEALIERIPEEENDKETYNRIELYSLKPSTDFDSLSKDISNLAQFISRFEMIMNTEHSSNKIYIQRIESGSLKIVWGSNTIELSGIGDIVKAICDGIRSFRLTSSEKKLLDEQARSAKLDNDQKELAIINSKVETIARILELSTENQENVETLQKVCLPLVRYLVNNPQGKVGEYEYDLDKDTKLIEYLNS